MLYQTFPYLSCAFTRRVRSPNDDFDLKHPRYLYGCEYNILKQCSVYSVHVPFLQNVSPKESKKVDDLRSDMKRNSSNHSGRVV